MHLTALNAKSEPETELAQEFTRVFGKEPTEAIEWAFCEWRKYSPFFPAISDIGGLLARWHREQREEAAYLERIAERKRLDQAREGGELIDFAEVRATIAQIARSKAPADGRIMSTPKGRVRVTAEEAAKRKG